MAKVRKFKDKQISSEARSRGRSNSTKQPRATEHGQAAGAPVKEQVNAPGTLRSLRENDPYSPSSRALSQSCHYPIRVAGVEEFVKRVRARAAQISMQRPALVVPPYAPRQVDRPPYRVSVSSTSGRRTVGPASVRSIHSINSSLHSLATSQRTFVQLAGYAGLEDLPVLRAMMNHPEVNKMHNFYFRFNDSNCPAAVLLVDPLPGEGRYAEWERNCCNAGHEAWLYTRKRGDVKWNRDFMAERGGMRQAIYLSRCEDGWTWEQQLGDLLDCRKSLNLWIKVKA